MEKKTLKYKINRKIESIVSQSRYLSLRPKYLSRNNNLYYNYKSFKNDLYDYKYTKNIVKNYVKKNNDSGLEKQKIYNYFIGGVINLCTNLLNGDYNNIFLRYKRIIKDHRNGDLYSFFKNIDESDDKNILLYIFFYIIPKTRFIIEKVKISDSRNDIDSNVGKLGYFVYNKDSDSNILHSLNMERFVNYHRLDIILNRINNISKIIPYNNEESNKNLKINNFYSEKKFKSTYKKKYDKHCFDDYYNIDNVIFKKYTILLDIPLEFFNENIELIRSYETLQNSSNLKIKFYTYNNKIKRMVYGIKNSLYKKSAIFHFKSQSGFSNLIGDNSKYKQNKETILNILIYCLRSLKENNRIQKKIEIIVVFYYLFIYLMPFLLGTSSISEIALYTLWNTYINIDGRKPLNINKNTMIDVEALSLTYTQFYYNCFNKESKDDIYTPYFLNNKEIKKLKKLEKNLNVKLLQKKINNLKKNITINLENLENNNILSIKDELREKLKIFEKNLKNIKNLQKKIKNFTINNENSNSLSDKEELRKELNKLKKTLHEKLLENNN